MNQIYYAKTDVDAHIVSKDPKVQHYVKNQLNNEMTKFINENANYSYNHDLEVDRIEFRSEVAILTVEEFYRLREIEDRYTRLTK